jgi:hypothetical protein
VFVHRLSAGHRSVVHARLSSQLMPLPHVPPAVHRPHAELDPSSHAVLVGRLVHCVGVPESQYRHAPFVAPFA